MYDVYDDLCVERMKPWMKLLTLGPVGTASTVFGDKLLEKLCGIVLAVVKELTAV